MTQSGNKNYLRLCQNFWLAPWPSLANFIHTILRNNYCKDTEPLFHSFMYSLVSLLYGIYPLPAKHSLLVTLYGHNI